MSTPVRLAWQLVAAVFAYAAFVGYGLCIELFASLIPVAGSGGLTYAVLMTQGFLAALIPSLVLCYPIARLYGRLATPVAVLFVAPALALRVMSLLATSRRPTAIAVSSYEIASYAVLFVGAVWLTQARVLRSNKSLERSRGA